MDEPTGAAAGERATELRTPLGRITVADGVIARIAARATAATYGIVGAPPRGLGRLLPRERAAPRIEVERTPEGLLLAAHVTLEHGLNLSEVAAAVRERVVYDVERLTGLAVARVDVHVDALRDSR